MALDSSGNTASDALGGSADDHIPTQASAGFVGTPCSDKGHHGGDSTPSLATQIRECFGNDEYLSEQFMTNAAKLLQEAASRMNQELREENDCLRANLAERADIIGEHGQLMEENLALWMDRILGEQSIGLTLQRKAELARLAESIVVDPEDPLASFEAQLKTIKQIHFTSTYKFPAYEDLVEDDGTTPDPNMQSYIDQMEKLNPQR